MQNTRNSTQVTKVSQLLKYVDRVVLAVSAVVHVGMRR